MLELALQDWFYRFRPFTTFHAVMAGVCFILIALACWLGGTRLGRGTTGERRLRLVWGWSIIASQAFGMLWRLSPERYTLEDGLPLHLCRVAGFLCGFAMIYGDRGQWRWARTLTYFWGLGLCFQGLVTPLRLDGFNSVDFWLFWSVHLQIVGCAIYDLVVLRYRPRLRDLGVAALASLAYVAVVLPFNIVMRTDYGWLGKGLSKSKDFGWMGDGRYRTRNIIDWLGDWPERPVLLVLLGLFVMTLMWGVWKVPGLFRASASPAPVREPIEAIEAVR